MYKYLITFGLCFFATSAMAGVWEEREFLERYIQQLEILNQTLLIDAEDAADPNHRITLNYRAVQRDAAEIVKKLKHHLDAPLEEYRSITLDIDTQQVEAK
ncbi:RAQPRD family integrative conjugative element protein [Vibrio sp. 1180_3]|uniref:RAQPRD family integrative conjugative element protein n=1 Tax=Vibrio sp. 1180_3 TaxID=2528832 RepID=UPI0024077354|nr:RAQPRD family integrative conjugative element protein [Vibrio sp. 1180_3]